MVVINELEPVYGSSYTDGGSIIPRHEGLFGQPDTQYASQYGPQ